MTKTTRTKRTTTQEGRRREKDDDEDHDENDHVNYYGDQNRIVLLRKKQLLRWPFLKDDVSATAAEICNLATTFGCSYLDRSLNGNMTKPSLLDVLVMNHDVRS